MKLSRKRFPGVKQLPGSAFLFFGAVCLLGMSLPAGFAAGKAPQQKKGEIFVQQIGPVGEEAPLDIGRVYNIVPAGKPLRISTQFKVVDDFNAGELKNSLGGAWFVDKGEEKKVRLDLKKEDARKAKSGASLWARVNLRKKEKATFRTSLERLDMSAAHYLALKCKMDPAAPFKGRLRVALTDWAGKTAERDITDVCLEGKGWNEVVLPMSVFMGVDLDQLKLLSFSAFARDRNLAGKIGLDEIAFVGHPEVGFESVEDNFVGFPRSVMDEHRREELLATGNDKELLLKIARDTWRYFENATDKRNHLVSDHFKVGDFPLVAAYTSPTNIALDLLGTVAARELGVITPGAATQRVQSNLATLKKLETWKGFFFNFYETTQLGVSRRFVSSVDNGWLAIALVVVRQAFPGEIARDASTLLERFHFQEFLDPDTNHLAIGYDLERQSLTPYHYGMLVTEARAMSLFAIGKGDLPKEHWWYLYRTAPEAWEWQTQKPQGKMVERDKVSYFQGYYKEGDKKFVPSWGGSLFEFLMPTMVIHEQKFAAKGLGLNDKIVVELHRDYALKEKKYPVWGISPSATADGRRWTYGEYGIRRLGVKGYPDRGVITPHASFLALDPLPKDAIRNIRQLLTFDMYGEYGFYDSITFPNKKVNTQYLALDQGMVLIPIANYLKKGVIQDYFHRDPIGKKAKELLEQEDFFKS
ncbi:MAG: glucoamylase family protein [Candidatus Omnitrophica bacterium]|nr:glucoamylase family protein [Candidatus Omnitrophota bacterium]